MTQKEIKAEVYCTLKVEGTHNWPNCSLDQVDYLRLTHRHLFGVTAAVLVSHDDRFVEFIDLKHQISSYLYNNYFNPAKQLHVFGAKSCEMIARELIQQFNLTSCSVDEDGENGVVLTVI